MALFGSLVRVPSSKRTFHTTLPFKYIAVFPFPYQLHPRFKDPVNQEAASGALRLTQNTGQSAFFGEKYKLDKVYRFCSIFLCLILDPFSGLICRCLKTTAVC